MADKIEFKPKPYLDPEGHVRLKQLEAIRDYLLEHGTNDEDINTELRELQNR